MNHKRSLLLSVAAAAALVAVARGMREDAAASVVVRAAVPAPLPVRVPVPVPVQVAGVVAIPVSIAATAGAAPTHERGRSGVTWTWRDDFRGAPPDAGRLARAENVEHAAGGFRLARGAGGAYVGEGVIVSAPVETSIAFHSVAVHWRDDLPVGTHVRIEVATSSDGVRWTAWRESFPNEHGDEVAEVFPDGRPNPNFGDTIGDIFSRTDNRGRFARWRATLRTDDGALTPLLGRVALTYMDTTTPGTTMVPQRETLD